MSVGFFIDNSYKVSTLITKEYSTSFSLATSFLEKEKRLAIYAVYGFVRLADEIVDSFHGFDKAFLLQKLNDDLQYALENKISTNPILMAFVDTVNKNGINRAHIQSFMDSMKSDLTKTDFFDSNELNQYIYGSADVVGLMCLKIFCNGQTSLYNTLEVPAQKLGSAFQKVNFIRDLKEDMHDLGRSYFPELSNKPFDYQSKQLIEKSIEDDFNEAWIGVKQLPGKSKLSVALAYYYYLALFRKIKQTSPEIVLSSRVRISNFKKYMLIVKVFFMYKTKLI